MTSYPQTIIDLAKAIAHAEGFGVQDAVPTRAHNPGDIKIIGWTGEKLGLEGITVFPTDEDGWEALYKQLERIRLEHSHIYSLNMTFTEFAYHWTDTQMSSWLMNVLGKLQSIGYNVNNFTTLDSFFQMVV